MPDQAKVKSVQSFTWTESLLTRQSCMEFARRPVELLRTTSLQFFFYRFSFWGAEPTKYRTIHTIGDRR